MKPNKNFFTYAAPAFDPTEVRSEVRFAHGPANTRPLNPIEAFMSTTAKDQLGFPTVRKIIDVEFEKIS